MSDSGLVQARHLQRKAVIYIRQSSGHQVLTNVESRRMQHAMTDRARQLGWSEAQIEVVESDTGMSGASTEGRAAYRRLLSEMALGDVGIVISYESTRLSRNRSDWYPLLDLCALRSCLIADRDGVYDTASANGRMLLGMKGIISEMELHTLRGRLTAGLLNKARRGELAQPLPAGFIRVETGQVVKDPDVRVQGAIDLVFRTYLDRGSARSVMRYFQNHDLKLPRQQIGRDLVWAPPSHSNILHILKNPPYAGAYVYGRVRPDPDGSSHPPRRRVPMEEWSVLLQDRYPKYVAWETFVQIQAAMKDRRFDDSSGDSRGAPREGVPILQGIVWCGECGGKMKVRYRPDRRYNCEVRKASHGAGICQVLPTDPIDKAVIRAFVAAISPAELDVYERASQTRIAAQAEVDLAHERELQRLQYESDLARRRYERIDPDNRLVAGELERRWETALQELEAARARITNARRDRDKVVPIKQTGELRAAFASLGTAMPGLWEGDTLSNAQRKAMLRCLVDKVVLRRPKDRREVVVVRVVWQGGAVSELDVPINTGNLADLSNVEELISAVADLNGRGLTDDRIADELSQRGFRAPKDPTGVAKGTVRQIRRRFEMPATFRQSRPRRVAGKLTIPEIAAVLGVRNHWFHQRIAKGVIRVSKSQPKPETPAAAAARRAQRLTRRPRIDLVGERPSWAELLKRVFAVDGFACPGCGGPLALRCIVLNPVTARRIIAGLQRATGPPESSHEGDDRTA